MWPFQNRCCVLEKQLDLHLEFSTLCSPSKYTYINDIESFPGKHLLDQPLATALTSSYMPAMRATWLGFDSVGTRVWDTPLAPDVFFTDLVIITVILTNNIKSSYELNWAKINTLLINIIIFFFLLNKANSGYSRGLHKN